MGDLIRDVISRRALRCDIGKVSLTDKISIENPKKLYENEHVSCNLNGGLGMDFIMHLMQVSHFMTHNEAFRIARSYWRHKHSIFNANW